MTAPPYVELHAHSGFSFLDGASHPEELVLQARSLGYPALALTDHNGLYGSMEFARAAREAEVQPITGVELSLTHCFEDLTPTEELAFLQSRLPVTPAAGTSNTSADEDKHGGWHVTLLAESPQGYANLCRLITKTHMESERGIPRLSLHELLDSDRTEGLICLTGCRRSPILAALSRSIADGETMLRRFRDAYGPKHLFIELQDNYSKGDTRRVRELSRLGERMDLPAVATGNVHYHKPERHRLQDVLVAIRHRARLDGSHAVRRPNRCFALASREEIAQRFHSYPEAIVNTLHIAERCASFDLTEDLGYTFPEFEGSEERGALETLVKVCQQRLEERYEIGSKAEQDAKDLLHRELSLIDRYSLAGFFLVYRDIMELAKEIAYEIRGEAPRASANLPPGRGRGSSVSSIICYLIGLSNIDPVRANLFLGRFLNEAMGTVPDIDLDFSRDIREELILRVYEKYGHKHTGLVCTFPTYRMKSTVREIGKVLDLPAGELAKLTKLAGHRSARGLREELEKIPEFAEMREAPLWQLLAELAEEAAGLPRHISQHVGGMIISSRPLLEMVPLEPAAWEGRFLCQWDKDSCGDAGFIKIDFLSLGMLSLVEDATDLIAERTGSVPDLSRIDFDDTAVYDRICDGDTVGLFQIESRAQIQMLRRVRPRTLPDLTVQVSIVRPGPIVAGAVNPYVRRRELLRENPDFEVPYDHPLLEEALGETLGVIIFQDQVLKVCQVLAGFTDGQAEGLRRAMSRKRSHDAMVAYWEEFREGAAARGVSEETARTIFTQVVAFSEFGFPKSHAAAFGLLAYQSAWLRHYHPVEYYVALFNNQPMGFYSLDVLGRDARRNGVKVLPPDVNQSSLRCTVEGDALRVGLGFVRGWGREITERVIDRRMDRGPFRSLSDFLRRTPAALKRPAIENMIWVGGFDAFGLTRRELLWQAGLWLGPESDSEQRVKERGGRDDHTQTELGLVDPYEKLPFPPLDDMDRLVAEYRVLRFSTARHPLSLLRHHLPEDTVTSDRFSDLPQHATVRVAGIVTVRQRPGTAKGYTFVLMEDEAGPINVIVKPEVKERHRSAVRMEPFLLVRGRLQKDGATMNVIAFEVLPLRCQPEVRSKTPQNLFPRSQNDWGEEEKQANPGVFQYLTALRQTPLKVKSFQ